MLNGSFVHTQLHGHGRTASRSSSIAGQYARSTASRTRIRTRRSTACRARSRSATATSRSSSRRPPTSRPRRSIGRSSTATRLTEYQAPALRRRSAQRSDLFVNPDQQRAAGGRLGRATTAIPYTNAIDRDPVGIPATTRRSHDAYGTKFDTFEVSAAGDYDSRNRAIFATVALRHLVKPRCHGARQRGRITTRSRYDYLQFLPFWKQLVHADAYFEASPTATPLGKDTTSLPAVPQFLRRRRRIRCAASARAARPEGRLRQPLRRQHQDGRPLELLLPDARRSSAASTRSQPVLRHRQRVLAAATCTFLAPRTTVTPVEYEFEL